MLLHRLLEAVRELVETAHRRRALLVDIAGEARWPRANAQVLEAVRAIKAACLRWERPAATWSSHEDYD